MDLHLSLEVIGPAVQGTVNILKSALEHGYVTVILIFQRKSQ